MPRYAYQKPVNRVYSYNKNYMQNYYKPLTHYIEGKSDAVERINRAPSEQPGHQSLAELRRIDPIWFRHPWDWDCVWVPPHENTSRPHFGVGTNVDLIRRFLAMRPMRIYSFDDYYLY